MYWYIKYPLYLFIALIFAISAYLGWGYLSPSFSDKIQQLIPVFGKPPFEDAGIPTEPPNKGKKTETQSANIKQVEENVSVTIASSDLTVASSRFDRQLFEQRMAAAEDQLKKESPLIAKEIAGKLLESPGILEFDPQWLQAVEILSQANTILINSDAPAPDKIRYIIQPGDTLIGMASKFQTTVAAIEKGNRLDSTKTNIYPGMVLNIFSGKWSITVVKTRFALTLYNNAKIFKFYRVGIGRQNRTPIGLFKIASKLRDPVWTPPGKVIPYGDPENVLGTRWLGLQPAEKTDSALKGYGIHGTWQPETVGTAASEGCIRMKNDEINELFDVVPMGTMVEIRD